MKLLSPLNPRFLGLAGTLFRANVLPPRLPYRLLFFLTDRCNCRCQTCSIWKQPPRPELRLSEIEQVLGNASAYLRWLHLSGGEMFLRPDIEDVFSLVASLRVLGILQFVTNATIPERVIRCAEIAAASSIPRIVVTLSLDGIGEDHDRRRGVPGLFEKLIRLYRELKSSFGGRVSPFLGLTVSKENQSDLPKIFRALQEGYDVPSRDVHVNFFHYAPGYYHNDPSCGLSQEEAAAAAEFTRRQSPFLFRFTPSGWLEAKYRRYYRIFARSGRTPLPCEALRGTVALTSVGECRPCSMFPQATGLISDWEYDLARYWVSSQRKEARKLIEAGGCPQCWTPCEAFPALLAHFFQLRRRRLG